MRQLVKPLYLFIAGVAMLVTGLLSNHFTRQEGLIILEAGQPKKLRPSAGEADSLSGSSHDISLTLDSVSIEPHTPDFELLTWYQKAPDNPHAAPSAVSIDESPSARYDTALMKIYRLGETDFYFRMKAFYPDFAFAYTYPENRDTLKPVAPGITLQLQSKEGSPIVTLGTTKPYRQTLDDLVGLGAPLAYYWTVDTDSLREAVMKSAGQKVIFIGALNSVWFVRGDSIVEDTLRENQFYSTQGSDSIGFTVLIAFPDAAYLRAEPSSASDEVKNPVAGVEIWREGEGATEAYLYPESAGKKGGKFAVSGTGYTLGMGYKKEVRVSHCQCHMTAQSSGSDKPRPVTLHGKSREKVFGYSLALDDCYSQAQAASLKVSAQKGSIWVIGGVLLLIGAVLVKFFGTSKTA